ncbi:B3 domain-containing protein At5g38500-like [Gossypium hirsutum]|uniref:B3 domain-containing protein At5g38500-like n=1 Tax=Gossypium hirsutum TaxID=3635 RepID=A0ABM3B1K7_GOSHI|nr:B3 domain-containing protein At5g38500-like [Gossypium hirsutum]
MMELLRLEDFKDTNVDPKWSAFDYLLEVTRVDQEKSQQRNSMQKKNKLKRKHQNSKNKRPIVSYPPPLLPQSLKQHIVEKLGGSDCVLVIQKKLFFSDVNPQASRFLIPFSQLKSHEFLNESEVKHLKTKKDVIKARCWNHQWTKSKSTLISGLWAIVQCM